MYDFNVSDHWPGDEPVWVKSLASSLDRRNGASTVLPLALTVEEIVDWAELASGEEAWNNKWNRRSLLADLQQSTDAVGATLRRIIDGALTQFSDAFANLIVDRNPALLEPPGARSHVTWSALLSAANNLLDLLDSDDAVAASWDDLVAAAQDRRLARREFRPIADLLYAQLTRRGMNAEQAFKDLLWMIAYGNSPDNLPTERHDLPAEARTARAREIAITAADTHDVVVWLGFEGRVSARLDAGSVTFYDALWAVPNAAPGGQDFAHKAELTELVGHPGLFKVAEHIEEKSDAETLVRVDLGHIHLAGAADRAREIVETIFNVALHFGGGIRPHLTQYGVLADGELHLSSFIGSRRETGFRDDHYGAGITAEAIDEHGPEIADALARQGLPRFLAAALEVQTTADHPFSRDVALRTPSQADISSVIPLSDRVVQHIAAHAAIRPNDAFNILRRRWAHARWLGSVRYAVHLCLAGGGQRNDLRDELVREWYNPKGPWVLFAADRAGELLSICRVESERAWIERVLASISDYDLYCELIQEYEAEGQVLEMRRRRVRNALVHGSPAHFEVVSSVQGYSEFLSSSALHAGMESYTTGSTPIDALEKRTAEATALEGGTDCATYWRSQRKPLS